LTATERKSCNAAAAAAKPYRQQQGKMKDKLRQGKGKAKNRQERKRERERKREKLNFLLPCSSYFAAVVDTQGEYQVDFTVCGCPIVLGGCM
jgi:hypothetical protein